jgi:hypothetical protein
MLQYINHDSGQATSVYVLAQTLIEEIVPLLNQDCDIDAYNNGLKCCKRSTCWLEKCNDAIEQLIEERKPNPMLHHWIEGKPCPSKWLTNVNDIAARLNEETAAHPTTVYSTCVFDIKIDSKTMLYSNTNRIIDRNDHVKVNLTTFCCLINAQLPWSDLQTLRKALGIFKGEFDCRLELYVKSYLSRDYKLVSNNITDEYDLVVPVSSTQGYIDNSVEIDLYNLLSRIVPHNRRIHILTCDEVVDEWSDA